MPPAPFVLMLRRILPLAGTRKGPAAQAAWCQWMMIDTVEYAGTVIVSLYVPAFVPRATGN